MSDMKKLIHTLGSNTMSSVPYDTAYVAMIPKVIDSNKPEFPESLQWIRDSQLPDGGWGAISPICYRSNIVNTLSAIIALKKWKPDKHDLDRIKRGEKALKNYANNLSEKCEPIGYELIIPNMITIAKRMNIELPDKELYDSQESDKKIELIKSFEAMHGSETKPSYLYNLEVMETLVESHKLEVDISLENKRIIEKNYSIYASPSATAFYITKFINQPIEQGFTDYIKQLVSKNSGGVPVIYPSDNFQISWSITAMIMADFDLQSDILKEKITQMFDTWNQFKGVIGSSSCTGPDCDVTAMYIVVLQSANHLPNLDKETLRPFEEFYSKSIECFTTFHGERNQSLSANIHALMALNLLSKEQIPNVESLKKNVLKWIQNRYYDPMHNFHDKWHLSPYYCTSRAIFALKDLDHGLCDRIVEQLLKEQKSDKGWGIGSKSTQEETALVCLALCFWFTNIKNIDKNTKYMYIKVFKSIDKFFEKNLDNSFEELWFAKVLYCPTVIVNALIISSKYRLSQILQNSN